MEKAQGMRFQVEVEECLKSCPAAQELSQGSTGFRETSVSVQQRKQAAMQTTHRIEENPSYLPVIPGKGSIPRIYKELLKWNIMRHNRWLKFRQWNGQTALKRRITNDREFSRVFDILVRRVLPMKATLSSLPPHPRKESSRHLTSKAGLAWGKQNRYSLLVGVPTSAVVVDVSMEMFLKIVKAKLPYDPAVLHLGIHPRNPMF